MNELHAINFLVKHFSSTVQYSTWRMHAVSKSSFKMNEINIFCIQRVIFTYSESHPSMLLL